MHKKRPAPKPPTSTNEINISQTTINKLDKTVAEESDHRIFVENLFDSTLQLQAPSSESVENKFVSSRIKEKPMTTTSTPPKKDNDKTNTATKGIKY